MIHKFLVALKRSRRTTWLPMFIVVAMVIPNVLLMGTKIIMVRSLQKQRDSAKRSWTIIYSCYEHLHDKFHRFSDERFVQIWDIVVDII